MKHPLNCGEITEEMLQRPEFQALQQLAYEGSPEEVAGNFKNHAYEQLDRLVKNESKNNEKDFQEALYCFEQALEQKCEDKAIQFELYVGKAKLNMLRG